MNKDSAMIWSSRMNSGGSLQFRNTGNGNTHTATTQRGTRFGFPRVLVLGCRDNEAPQALVRLRSFAQRHG